MAKRKNIPDGDPLPQDKKPKFTNDPEYLGKSRAELEEFARKRILTAVIKCLESFEETFGDNWGHFSKDKRNKDQERERHKWQNARKFILAYAHDQMDLLSEEMDFYDISKKWFNIHVEVKE